ncbi:hypothetical protein [Chitinophaga solisilvae]|uniref:hypothetical protein n=1 Tax=Chitinophaga solisilvae TaxID=1233460 RepID=UPI00136A20EC|nr:hypothetical protein [Chitinophaga solisilvae]
MMNKRFLLTWILSLLLVMVCSAQSVVTANRVTVRDSLSLRGRWITGINNEGDLRNASTHTLSTDAALKQYIDDAASGKKENRFYINYFFDQFVWGPLFRDSLQLEVISADSIVTSFTMQNRTADWLYAYGKPPYTIRGRYIGHIPGVNLSCDISNAARIPYSAISRTAYVNDTLQLLYPDLRYGVDIYCMLNDSINNLGDADTLVKLNVELINYTSRNAFSLFWNDVPPGKSFVYTMPVHMSRATGIEMDPYYSFRGLYVAEDGVAINMWHNRQVRIMIFKNGDSIPAWEHTSGTSERLPLKLDTTWKDMLVVFSYVPVD